MEFGDLHFVDYLVNLPFIRVAIQVNL